MWDPQYLTTQKPPQPVTGIIYFLIQTLSYKCTVMFHDDHYSNGTETSIYRTEG
jgi:hypothetical protein